MWNQRYYRKSLGRQPVFMGPYSEATDLQGAIPRSWCRQCGREIFERGRQLCGPCRKRGYANEK